MEKWPIFVLLMLLICGCQPKIPFYSNSTLAIRTVNGSGCFNENGEDMNCTNLSNVSFFAATNISGITEVTAPELSSSNSSYGTSFEDYKIWVEDYEIKSEKSMMAYKRVEWSPDYIDLKARELRGESVQQTIWNTYNFLQEIEWHFYDVRRGPDVTFKQMKGDCTDKSELGALLLRLNGIYARQVHGYFTPDNSKHDWMEVLSPNTKGWVEWETVDNLETGYLEKEGEGTW